MLDTKYSVETPEGVHIRLRVVGPLTRALAWVIDVAFRSIVLMILLPLGIFGTLGWTLYGIIAFLLWWFYWILFEVFRNGQTPGKQIMGIAVVHGDGTPVGWRASMLRNLLRAADLLPAIYGVGLISTLFSKYAQRLGDLVAGTLVVYRETYKVTKVNLPRMRPLPPPLPLTLTEQRALISFGESARQLTAERMEELSDILKPLSGQQGHSGKRALLGYAAWLVGARK